MKKIFTLLTAGTMVLGATTGAFAQETALQQAERIRACNDASIVSARFLESGRLEVTCPAGYLGANGLPATGLTSTQIAAGIGAILVIAFIINDDGTTSTTTTTLSSGS
ncbi:MAG: hypothetical protein ACI92Z_001380 [Paracoccaceae bacterium]|jgi:hypothetical protein